MRPKLSEALLELRVPATSIQNDPRSHESTTHLLRSGFLKSLDALFLGGKVGDLGGDLPGIPAQALNSNLAVDKAPSEPFPPDLPSPWPPAAGAPRRARKCLVAVRLCRTLGAPRDLPHSVDRGPFSGLVTPRPGLGSGAARRDCLEAWASRDFSLPSTLEVLKTPSIRELPGSRPNILVSLFHHHVIHLRMFES